MMPYILVRCVSVPSSMYLSCCMIGRAIPLDEVRKVPSSREQLKRMPYTSYLLPSVIRIKRASARRLKVKPRPDKRHRITAPILIILHMHLRTSGNAFTAHPRSRTGDAKRRGAASSHADILHARTMQKEFLSYSAHFGVQVQHSLSRSLS